MSNTIECKDGFVSAVHERNNGIQDTNCMLEGKSYLL